MSESSNVLRPDFRRTKSKNRKCNLCSRHFVMHSPFERFCQQCKQKSELLRYGDWLPEIDETLAEKIPAA